MNAPRDLTPHEKARLALAAKIAAGMCANPETYVQNDWKGEVARSSMAVADRLLLLAYTGGC